MKLWQQNSLSENCFLLPHEAFELDLERGALLAYLFLVHHKYLKHGADRLSCAAVSKAVGLCEKTVRRHLHALMSEKLIHVSSINGSVFTYSLCPIWDKVQERCDVDLLRTHEGDLSA